MARLMLVHALALFFPLACPLAATKAEAQLLAASVQFHPETQVSLAVINGEGQTIDATAIVWREDGLLVTAAHVVAGARKIMVRSANQPARVLFPADLIGLDTWSDIAVLKAPTTAQIWTTAPHARSQLALGAPVRAFGNPLGYGGTLTAGIVSALERSYRPTSPYDLIQHDAALNPGSSGGPLLDGNGHLVGMNVAIADSARRHIGISFAVPLATLQHLVPRLEAGGVLPRPSLGLRFREDRGLSAAIPALRQGGILVEHVASGGPADKAGLQGGDILLTVEGQPVSRIRDLARVLEPLEPGMELRLVLRRGDHEHPVSLVLGKEAREPPGLSGPPAKPSPVLFGLIFSGNQSDIRSVVAGSPAAKAGLRTGDRIQAVGARAVSTRREVASALEAAVDDKVALLVQRGGRGRYLVLDAKAGLDVTPRFGMNNEAAGSEAM